MEKTKCETFFWIQKKNECGKNIVVVNEDFASFEKIPKDLISLRKREFLLSQSQKTKISCYLMYRKKLILYIEGITDERDSAGRNVAYNFICRNDGPIDGILLENVKENVLNCMNLVDSIAFFDEEDFNEALVGVNLEECNSPSKELLKREYANDFKSIFAACGMGVILAVNIFSLIKTLFNYKGKRRL